MEPFLGQIQLIAFNFLPQGWAFAEGQVLGIRDNQSLYVILRTQFGGDGRTTFGLPDLKGKEPLPNTRYCIALEGTFPAGF